MTVKEATVPNLSLIYLALHLVFL